MRRYVTSMPSIGRVFNSMWDNMERDIRTSSAPENGRYITYETTEVHWQRESNENGDVIYRRLTQDEVEANKTNDAEKEGNK